ncbi:hypothetical protein [Methanomethylovorans sp.]
MQKCDICKKETDRLMPLKGKSVCKDCFTESSKEELDTGSLDVSACI